ncbi:unnamed protein product [Closterium sp. NIES-54]
MVHQVLQRFGFQFSSPQSTPLPTGHSLSAPPLDESVELSGPYPELVGCLIHRPEHWEAAKRVLHYLCSTSGMGLVLGGRGPVVLTGHANASWVDDLATQRSSQGYTFSLGSGSVSWRSTRSSSVLSSSCEVEIYAGAMAAQELHWLTYLLTDLGEQPRSSPVLYVDNKAMIALCQEHRLEHRTKHISLRYFLAQDLQQRGQLCLAYMAIRANTADIHQGTLVWDFDIESSLMFWFESQCVHFGHPSAGGCQRCTGDPRLILEKGYRFVVLGGYGCTDPLPNKPFYPSGLVTRILTLPSPAHPSPAHPSPALPLSYSPLSCSPLSCSLLSCSPLSCSPLSCSPISCSPISCSPLSCSPPISCSPLSCSPLSCSPLSFSPLSFSPLSCSPLSCSPLSCSYSGC